MDIEHLHTQSICLTTLFNIRQSYQKILYHYVSMPFYLNYYKMSDLYIVINNLIYQTYVRVPLTCEGTVSFDGFSTYNDIFDGHCIVNLSDVRFHIPFFYGQIFGTVIIEYKGEVRRIIYNKNKPTFFRADRGNIRIDEYYCDGEIKSGHLYIGDNVHICGDYGEFRKCVRRHFE